MMKLTTLFSNIFILFATTAVLGQQTIQSENFQMTISDLKDWDESVSYRDPRKQDDPIALQLFKNYFHPESFETYRSFFLAKDWGGFTEADFDAWQAYLHKNKLTLEKTFRVHDDSNHEFIICQYTVETNEHIIPSTAIFKKTQNAWKHISFINDPQAHDLKQIGLLKTEYLMSIPRDGSPRLLNQIPMSGKKEALEKFDRQILFEKIKNSLLEKGVSPSDIRVSETLFLEKAEVEMVKFIGRSYSIDPYVLMEELNTVIGFSLYKFTNTLKN